MKDRFSEKSENYQKYRPAYPQELYDFLLTLVSEKEWAWDCGTGNGQVAVVLSSSFDKVYATDISEKQLQQAPLIGNIVYQVRKAENTSFSDNCFDLITVAQAVHWFDFDLFYNEVRRTAKPNGILAVMGYGLFRTEGRITQIIDRFYTQIIGSYWDKERRYIDENYKTIPFPFEEIKAPAFHHQLNWNFPQLIGYLNTWSAVQLYEKKKGMNPITLIEEELSKAWGSPASTKEISFPILLRIGKIHK